MRISFWPGANQTWEDVLDLARHVEAKGWDGIWYADHFMPDDEDTSEDCNEMWSTLAGLAATVPRLRIGSMVSCNTYRHPAVLAKMQLPWTTSAAGGWCWGWARGGRRTSIKPMGWISLR